MKELIEACSGSRVRYRELLAPYTTFKVGGSAEYFIEPQNRAALLRALAFLQENTVRIFILGGGSNLVIADAGLLGAVVATHSLAAVSLLSDGKLLCEAGATFEAVSDFCARNGLGGLAEFCGLPGTVGGAVFMNARCYEKSISNVLLEAEYIDVKTLSVCRYVFTENNWDYKKSPFQNTDKIILSALFRVENANAKTVREQNTHFFTDRKTRKQFDFPSAGSVFKNNRSFGAPSGKIIDEVGLCGTQLGGAQIAPWHGNFIINTGSATAADIRNLTTLIIERVQAAKGIILEPEILFIGF